MSVISGKDGTLLVDGSEALGLTQWLLRKTSANKAYTANDTGGARKRVAGVKDCSGRCRIKAARDRSLPLDEGDAVTLQLHVDDSGENYYEVPAVVDAVRLAADVSRGKIVTYVCEFSGNGPVTAYGVLDPATASGSSGS